MSEQENKPQDTGPGNQEEPVETSDAAGDEAPQADPGRWAPLVLGAGLVIVALFWWLSRTPTVPAPPAQTPVAVVATPTPDTEPATPPPVATEAPAETPVTPPELIILEPTVALPTVTPTSAPTQVATRTVSIGGSVTLRLSLEARNFESSGRPVDKPLEPRSYTLGAGALTVADRWCMQMGVANLLF